MEDRRAHERIDDLSEVVKKHLEEHTKFEEKLDTAVANTQIVANNTSELVELFRGAKGIRKLVVFSWPFLLVMAALIVSAFAYVKGGK